MLRIIWVEREKPLPDSYSLVDSLATMADLEISTQEASENINTTQSETNESQSIPLLLLVLIISIVTIVVEQSNEVI